MIDPISADRTAARPAPVAKRHDVTAVPARERLRRSGPAPQIERRSAALSACFDGSCWIAVRVATDLLMLAVACAVALALTPGAERPWALALFAPVTLIALGSGGRYHRRMRDAALDRSASGVAAISTGAMMAFALILLSGGDPAGSGPLVAWTWCLALTGVTLTAFALVALQRALRRHGLVERRTLIVGGDAAGVQMAERLARMPEYGMRAVGFVDTTRGRGRRLPAGAPPLLGGLDDLAAVAQAHDVQSVIVCFPEVTHDVTLALVARCEALGLETTVMPRLSAAVNFQTRFEYFGVQPLLHLRAVDPDGWRFDLKHAVDRLLAGIALVLLSPLMLTLALLVSLSSPGPILFRQARTGRDGRLFELLKFRTMIEPDAAAVYTRYPELRPQGMAPGGVEGVDRRTRVGTLLRRTSLDELPQLVNVLRGEMSLVGPRPERPEYAELFRSEVARYHDRHRVRAGITGWAQVHGSRGQTPVSERVELDNFYIEHWSLALDAKIMLLTFPALLRGS